MESWRNGQRSLIVAESGGDRWRASERTLLRGLPGVALQLHPVPNLLLLGHASCPPHHKEKTHTYWHTESPGICAGEKIPWKIPESWAFKSLEAALCFKAQWAAFMLCVAPAWMASTLQVADKGGLQICYASENWYNHCSAVLAALCGGPVCDFTGCCCGFSDMWPERSHKRPSCLFSVRVKHFLNMSGKIVITVKNTWWKKSQLIDALTNKTLMLPEVHNTSQIMPLFLSHNVFRVYFYVYKNLWEEKKVCILHTGCEMFAAFFKKPGF